jgi:hypothetical protein
VPEVCENMASRKGFCFVSFVINTVLCNEPTGQPTTVLSKHSLVAIGTSVPNFPNAEVLCAPNVFNRSQVVGIIVQPTGVHLPSSSIAASTASLECPLEPWQRRKHTHATATFTKHDQQSRTAQRHDSEARGETGLPHSVQTGDLPTGYAHA